MKMETEINCEECEYYDKEEGICGAFVCTGIDCPDLPCEMQQVKSAE